MRGSVPELAACSRQCRTCFAALAQAPCVTLSVSLNHLHQARAGGKIPHMRPGVKFLLAVVLLAVSVPPVSADVIVSVTRNPANGGFGGATVASDRAAAVEWTISGGTTYSNVDISFNYSAYGPGTAMAYLLSSIGPGTTAADAIADTSFSYDSLYGTDNFIHLFSGLTLGSGTYYLVIGPVVTGDEILWASTPEIWNPPVVTTAPGVTVGDSYTAGYTSGYAPAADFTSLSSDVHFIVTGDEVDASTPEPATFGLFGGSILLFGFARKRLL